MTYRSSADSWTRYWRAGNLDTCFVASDSFSARELWQDFFASLAPDSHVLDLATGNGTVALIAAEVSAARDLNLRISAVDQADIDPLGTLKAPGAQLQAITFTPNTYLEQLPFADGSIDAFCSQFGFEYADTDKAVAEIGRVAARGARVCLLIHAENGEVEKSARLRRERIKQLHGRASPLEYSLELAALQRKRSSHQGLRLDKLENRVLTRLRKIHGDLRGVSPDDVALNSVNYLGTLVSDRRSIGIVDFERLVKDLDGELRAYVVRLNTMVNAAMSQSAMARLQSQLAGQAFSDCSFSPVNDQRGCVAWHLQARRQ